MRQISQTYFLVFLRSYKIYIKNYMNEIITVHIIYTYTKISNEKSILIAVLIKFIF